jgi:hypothetical protein
MKWRWQDVQDLPADVYRDLIEWLNDEANQDDEVIDMDARADGV